MIGRGLQVDQFAGRDDEVRRHHDVLYPAVIGTPIPGRQARANVGEPPTRRLRSPPSTAGAGESPARTAGRAVPTR